MESKFQTLKLAEQGAKLPVGISDNAGGLARDIVLRPWRMKEERELGDLRDKNRDANMAQYVSMVLATMCTKLGPHNFEGMKYEERRVHIAQMYMGDVFYAYVWLRIQALGHDFDVKVNCQSCGKKSQMTADLNSIIVRVVEKLDDAMWKYKVKLPFPIRQKPATELTLGPPRWTIVEGIPTDSAMNTGSAKSMVIRGSVSSVNDDKPLALADSELDEMSKRDLEALTRMIDDQSPGPVMVMDDKCPKCQSQMKLPIDWSYDSFFVSSTR